MALLKAHTETGVVVGCRDFDPRISIFKGIPFAAPPTGEYRWKDPRPVIPWRGERECFRFANIPIQPLRADNFYKHEFYPVEHDKSEDCLYLNVWTPAEDPNDKLPVFLWIYGGGFVNGLSHSMYADGASFAREGIVFVSFNYRLGLLGFYSTPLLDAESPSGTSGNYGLKDQMAAVRWVRENIAAFGGDPEKITLGGQSAGAVSVQALCSSPLLMENSLRGAVMHSGGGFYAFFDRPFLSKEEVQQHSIEDVLGVATLEAARALSTEEILFRQAKFQKVGPQVYYPIVDGFLLTEDLNVALANGRICDIPYILGCTEEEKLFYKPQNPDEFVRYLHATYGEQAGRYLSHCPVEDDEAFGQMLLDNMTENLEAGIYDFARCRGLHSQKPVWLYQFTRKLPGDDRVGAIHSADYFYVFKTLRYSHRPMSEIDYNLSQSMFSFWSNFIRNGDPNGERLPSWQCFNKWDPRYMELGDFQRMRKARLNARELCRSDILWAQLQRDGSLASV